MGERPAWFTNWRHLVRVLGLPVTLALVFWLAFAVAWLVIR